MIAGWMIGLTTFLGCLFLIPVLFRLARLFGVYTLVGERECKVYVLFGKVMATLDQPGLHFLWPRMGAAALIVNWMGTRYVLDGNGKITLVPKGAGMLAPLITAASR